MLITTSCVKLLHYAPYSDPSSPDPLIWGPRAGDAEGQLIHKLMVLDGSTVLDNITVDPAIKNVPPLGSDIEMTCEMVREQVVRHSINGKGFVGDKYKLRVVKLKTVAAAAPAPAPASQAA